MQTLSRRCMGGITLQPRRTARSPRQDTEYPRLLESQRIRPRHRQQPPYVHGGGGAKIKFVENPGAFKAGLKAHKTWQIQQDAYCELLDNGLSNPQKITCIIFENLFGPYFLPHQSHSYGYDPSSGENLTSKMSFISDATYYFHITKESLKGSGRSMECVS